MKDIGGESQGNFVRSVETVPTQELLHPQRVLSIGREVVYKSGRINYPGEPNQLNLLRLLEPRVATELDRHERMRQPWVPADFFPIDDDGRILYRQTDPDATTMLSPAAHASMLVNLLTEDNLPSYHRVIANNFGTDGAWGTWSHTWTAEEDNHAYAMRAFLDLTRAIDPRQNEEARMMQMKQGYGVEKSPLNTLVYVTFQELATRVSHRQTGFASNNELADAMLARIAKDENLHMMFYRNLVSEALELAPNQTMRAICDEVKSFEMPGSNIDGFQVKALMIAEAGIYDLRRHLDEIIMPVLKHWRIFEREFREDGEVAREELATYLTALTSATTKFEERRDSGALARTINALQSRQ